MDMGDSFTLKLAVSLIAICFCIAAFQRMVQERKIHALGGRAHPIRSYLPFGLLCPLPPWQLGSGKMICSNRY